MKGKSGGFAAHRLMQMSMQWNPLTHRKFLISFEFDVVLEYPFYLKSIDFVYKFLKKMQSTFVAMYKNSLVSPPFCSVTHWTHLSVCVSHLFSKYYRVLKTTVHMFFWCVISITISNHVRDIKDPEHPYSLEELKVITEDAIEVDNEQSHVR